MIDALVSPDNFRPRDAPRDGYNIRNGYVLGKRVISTECVLLTFCELIKKILQR